MNNDAKSELLDAEFRQILYIIKPLINHIDDHYNLEKYRVWLERLSSVQPAEKLERNKYLLELANQIHDNILEPPFTHNPPKGLLPSLKMSQKGALEADAARISEHFFDDNTEETRWPFVPPRKSQEAEDRSRRNVASKTKHVHPFHKIGKIVKEEIKSETTSWCDLTDTSVDDNEENLKIQIIKKYDTDETDREARESFMKKFSEDKISKKSNKGSSVFSTEEFIGKGRKPTEEEVEALKMRMRDLLEVKNALRDTHCLTEDRKKIIESLQEKLLQVQRENTELKAQLHTLEKRNKLHSSHLEQENVEMKTLLDAQQKKFMELDKAKNKEMGEYKEKFTLLRQKEVDYLNQYHKDELAAVEKLHTCKLLEMESKMSSLKSEYEDKIKNISESTITLLKQREEEIEKLQSELKIQPNQPVAEGDQVQDLKTSLSQMEQMLHKNDKEHAEKIERMSQELQVKEMTTQVQLQTQRADLIMRNAAIKQEEMKNALNSLEGKYKKMMETIQRHALETKKHDDKLIEQLRCLLQKHNIAYNPAIS